MGVFARRRKSGTVYYVSFQWNGKQVQELSGSDKRVAQQLERQRKREVRDGTYAPNQSSARPTLAEFAERWLTRRRTRTVNDDKARLGLHVLPKLGAVPMDEIRPKHVRALIEALRERNAISPKTIRNVYGTLRTLFRDAVLDELVLATPCVLPNGVLPATGYKEKQIYSREQVALLFSSPKIPLDRRVFYALAALTGMRHGEAAGRRWRHFDPDAKPLACLEVGTQYDDQPLKTSTEKSRPRRVPVHPRLGELLDDWKREGFPLYFHRSPEPNDFIVPDHLSRSPLLAQEARRRLHPRGYPAAHVPPAPGHVHLARASRWGSEGRAGARDPQRLGRHHRPLHELRLGAALRGRLVPQARGLGAAQICREACRARSESRFPELLRDVF
jgi:integrase